MKLKKYFSILVLLVLIIWLLKYFLDHINEFKQITIVSYNLLFLLFVLAILFLVNNGLILKYLLEPFKIFLSKKEWFGLSIITTMGNYLTPFRGGAIARAVYLKKKHIFQYSSFLSTLSAIYVIAFLVNSFVGIISVFLIYLLYNQFNIIIFLLFLFIFIFLLFITLFSPKFKETRYSIVNKFINVINGWHLIKSNKKIIKKITLINIINIAIITLMMFLEFKVFGFDISLTKALFIAVVSTLSLFISITPGALGIREAIIVFSAKVIGVTTTQALLVALLDRAIYLTIIFILGPIFSYILLKKSMSKENEKNN